VIQVVLNLVLAVVGLFVTLWVSSILVVVAFELATRLAWIRRGVLGDSSSAGAIGKALLGLLMGLGPLAILVGLLWWFAPSALGWVAHGWGLWAGVGLGALWELIHWRRPGERLAGMRVEFYGENKDAIPARIGARQSAYVKRYRLEWELAEAAAAAEAEAAEDGADEQDEEDEEDGEDYETEDDHELPHLDFVILAAHEGQRVQAEPPYFAKGGDWTVLSCRTATEPAAAFFLAEKSGPPKGDLPLAWGEGRIWVATAEDGRRLAEAVAAAFRVPAQGSRAAGKPGAPLTFGTAVFSRTTAPQPDGSLSGEGTWTASKWTFEEATEVFVNWSRAEKAGRFAEKDEEHREDLYEAFSRLAG
jgi:hypothetical protein